MTQATVVNAPFQSARYCGTDPYAGIGVAARSVDVIVTSPPYLEVGVRYNGKTGLPEEVRDEFPDAPKWYVENSSRTAYAHLLRDLLDFCCDFLSDSGSVFVNIDGCPAHPEGPRIFEQMLQTDYHSQNWVVQNRIIWVKSITVPGADSSPYSVGHFKPINSERFLNHNWEHVYHITRNGKVPLDRLAVGVPYADQSNRTRWGDKNLPDVRCGGDVWFIPYETIQSKKAKGNHPAIFPEELPRRCILLHGVERCRMVVDPFLGSGTSCVAAKRLGVPSVGFEVDPEYCDYAVKRIEGVQG